MPVSKYNPYFGGKVGSAQEAKSAMSKQYGAKKGDSVFYALVNKRGGHAGGRRRRRRRKRKQVSPFTMTRGR